MKIVGRVESLWRYPVKSMRGEVVYGEVLVDGTIRRFGAGHAVTLLE